jgi:hypothetical protein
VLGEEILNGRYEFSEGRKNRGNEKIATTRSFTICCYGDEIKENKMGGACTTHRKYD